MPASDDRLSTGPILHLRPATNGDRVLLWEWANDPASREASLNTATIPWDEHDAWFDHCLADDDTHIFIGVVGERAVGQVRFEAQSNGTIRVSLSVDRDHRGLGYSRQLLRDGVRRLHAARQGPMVAQIREANTASLRCFLGEGFDVTRRSEGIVHLRLDDPAEPVAGRSGRQVERGLAGQDEVADGLE